MKHRKVNTINTETTIAKSLYVTDDSVGYDTACKRVLSEKVILARIMKACLVEYQDCDVNEIAEKYIEGSPQVSVVPDSEEQIGLIVNVEAQSDFYPGYPLLKRGIYYCCRMISSQYGREFTDSHYEKIKKVYSIWICMNPPKHRENTITRYHLAEEQFVGRVTEPVRNYDLISVIMICLGGSGGENYNGILRMLDVLLSHETSEAEKRKILQDEYDIQMTQAMESEVSVMCNLSKGVIEKSVAKGMAQGMAQGIEQGMAQGIESAVLSSIKNLVKNTGMSVSQAMSVLEVLEVKRQEYKKSLEEQ